MSEQNFAEICRKVGSNIRLLVREVRASLVTELFLLVLWICPKGCEFHRVVLQGLRFIFREHLKLDRQTRVSSVTKS